MESGNPVMSLRSVSKWYGNVVAVNDVTLDDGALLVLSRNVAGESYDTVRDSLAESGARLRRMAPRRHRLTEIFRR